MTNDQIRISFQKLQNCKLSIVNSRRSRGYTLIEILVGLSIVGLIFGIGFIGSREFSRRQVLLGVARQMRGDLRFAQELALAGKKPAVCAAGDALDGFYFVVIPSGSYEVRAVCGATVSLEKAVTLPTGITLSGLVPDLTPSNTLLFKILGQGTNIAAGGITTITLTQAITGNTHVITVTAGGEIR